MKAILFLLLFMVATALQNTAQRKAAHDVRKEEKKVLICNGSKSTKYHLRVCDGLSKCTKTISEVSIVEAKKKGFTPCGYCY